jgi:hypothetical protein
MKNIIIDLGVCILRSCHDSDSGLHALATLGEKAQIGVGSRRLRDTQHNDTQHNDIQHNDIQHNDTQHNST